MAYVEGSLRAVYNFYLFRKIFASLRLSTFALKRFPFDFTNLSNQSEPFSNLLNTFALSKGLGSTPRKSYKMFFQNVTHCACLCRTIINGLDCSGARLCACWQTLRILTSRVYLLGDDYRLFCSSGKMLCCCKNVSVSKLGKN